MATTAIIVNATDALGKSAQKSVTNVNPAATNSQLVSLGQAINAISNNTYGGTVRIDKTDCDTEQSVVKKPVPTLTVELADTGEEGAFVATYSGDGTLHIIGSANDNDEYLKSVRLDNVTLTNGVFEFDQNTLADGLGITHMVVYATETDNFAAAVAVWNEE